MDFQCIKYFYTNKSYLDEENFRFRRGKLSERSEGVVTYIDRLESMGFQSIKYFYTNKSYLDEENFRFRRGKPSKRSEGVVTYIDRLESMGFQCINQNFSINTKKEKKYALY